MHVQAASARVCVSWHSMGRHLQSTPGRAAPHDKRVPRAKVATRRTRQHCRKSRAHDRAQKRQAKPSGVRGLERRSGISCFRCWSYSEVVDKSSAWSRATLRRSTKSQVDVRRGVAPTLDTNERECFQKHAATRETLARLLINLCYRIEESYSNARRTRIDQFYRINYTHQCAS